MTKHIGGDDDNNSDENDDKHNPASDNINNHIKLSP